MTRTLRERLREKVVGDLRAAADLLATKLPPMFACPECGSPEVERLARLDVNTLEILDDGSPQGDEAYHCRDCHAEPYHLALAARWMINPKS